MIREIMKCPIRKLYEENPSACDIKVSLNILLSQQSSDEDGIRKEKCAIFPEKYYNEFYCSRMLRKIVFYKIICLSNVVE